MHKPHSHKPPSLLTDNDPQVKMLLPDILDLPMMVAMQQEEKTDFPHLASFSLPDLSIDFGTWFKESRVGLVDEKRMSNPLRVTFKKESTIRWRGKPENKTPNNPTMILFGIRWSREKFWHAFRVLLFYPTTGKKSLLGISIVLVSWLYLFQRTGTSFPQM